jgi:purine-binding chemotaxis protein CheW
MNQKAQRINWESVRSRLAQQELALEKALVADTARIEGTFERRATQLARRRALAGAATAALPVQVFLLGEQRYGIELSELTGVVTFNKGACTPVPEAPAEILGVINLRGEVRVVADLSRLLGLSNGATHQPTGYVLLAGERRGEVGLRVDGLDQIQLFSQEVLTTSDTEAGNLPARYVKAFTPDKVILLSIAAIRSHPAFADRVGNDNLINHED